MTDLDPTDVFRQEAAELLDNLEATLLDLGATPDDRELIDAAFRALHTIKGSGSMFGFDDVARFTHDFETAFDLVRKGKAAASRDLVDVALAAKDYIRALIENPSATDSIIGDAILADLQRYVSASRADAGEAPTAPIAEAAPASANSAGWSIAIAYEPGVLRNGCNPLALLDDLRALGDCVVTADCVELPEIEALDAEGCFIKWRVELAADCDRAAIEDVFMFVRDEMSLVIEPLVKSVVATTEPALAPSSISSPQASVAEARAETVAPEASSSAAPRAESARKIDDKAAMTVRVQAERLDELMDRVGELVIAQARLSQLAGSGQDLAIKAIAEEIARLASALRDTTMGVRMVPIGSLFGRFRRLVHDLSRDLGKPVEFVTSGEDTELDKTMIERLADPLVHLIRNAIDHGIEEPSRRAASGKAAEGAIHLSAQHVGAQVLVTVQDNGAGLDRDRIRAKAEEQGLVAPGVVLSDQEIYQFLFHPGFSTAKTVSALSGRGVGMDVVKRTIEAMRGSIDIATAPGQGTTVTLRLPLTLAIIEGLLIRVGADRYIIPLSAVEECVELAAAEDDRSRGRDFLNVRGELVPFLRLRDLFVSGGTPDRHQKVIIASTGEMRVGLVADQIIGSHQTVIKSLSKLHSDVTMFSGATILGDGAAALILDVGQLVALGEQQAGALSEAA